jgi:hypothetical protein
VETCDDCGQEYATPAYYSFDPDGCVWTEDNGAKVIPHDCTSNLCPECAGPYLEPDDPADARRPADG